MVFNEERGGPWQRREDFSSNGTNYVFHLIILASAINLEGELFKDLMKGYNKNVRPTEKSGDITQVDIKMTLTNLISLVSEI